ncbi:21999_t:CDS:2, partial [Cetraspora pellucida]
AKLREFANNVLNKETIQEEWSKKKDQELEQNKGNYDEGISTIPFRMQFEEPTIIDLADQMGRMTIHAQNEKPINKAQQKLNEQLIVDVQEEIKSFKKTNGIVPKNRKEKQKEIQTTIPDTPRIGRFVKENLTQLERLRYRLQTIENNYKYVSNLPDEELESHLGT